VLIIGTGSARYGPLQENFEFVVPEGYSVLVGANNSGKSGLLQQAFRAGCDENSIGVGGICLILPDRTQLLPSTETQGRALEGFNQELVQHVRGTLLSYEQYTGPQRGEQARLLLNHTDFERQLQELQVLLARLGLARLVLRTSQSIHFDDIAGHFQGSGLRALRPILCALTDDSLRLILIYEPEEALEPRLQKALRDLLIEKSEGRGVMVATHSHLFLNRREGSANYRVSRTGANVSVEPVTSAEELYGIAFSLLGNSTEDLFFPANYLLVEGASDQIVVERVLALMNVPHGRIKVVSAGGVDAVQDTLAALERALLPVVMEDSPYAQRVVALIDQPAEPGSHTMLELERVLGDRLIRLDEPSLEEAIPEDVYEKAGLNRVGFVEDLNRLRGDYRALHAAKRRVSRELARVVEVDDLESLGRIREAVERALAAVADI
jgi:hypothetical protein